VSVSRNAQKLFEEFHRKRAGTPVFPFDRDDDGDFALDVVLPDVAPVGLALRTMYRSDKWEEPGSVHDYYHDHDAGKVRLWLPSRRGQDFPHEWPEGLTHLGQALPYIFEKDGRRTERRPKNTILACSPKGFVSRLRPSRVFLVWINLGTGKVEALAEGESLRLTGRGIEG